MELMTRALPGSVLTVVLSLAAPVVHAQDAAKGVSLLAAARTALGGDAALGAVKTIDMKADFKRSAGQNTAEGALEIRLERPDKMRRDEDLSLPGGGPAIVRTEVLNGTEVWDENSGGGFGGFGGGRGGRGGIGGGGFGGARRDADQPGAQAGAQGGRAFDPAQMKELQLRARQADVARLNIMWLLETDGAVAWVGTAEAPDGKADVVELTPAGGAPMRVFLDQTSHLPLMLTWQGPAFGARRGRGAEPAAAEQAPQRQTLQITLGQYKTVNGIALPHLITRGANGQTVEEWNVKSYKINPSFKSDVFKK
jgi:hypothetical protein